MVFLRQEHILWFMIRNIWFDSGFNAKTHSLKTPQLLKHMMFRGISLLCLVMLLRAKEHCVVALVRKSHGETGSWPFSQSLRWCSHIHHKLVHGFCHWYHLHISNLLCFLNSKGLSSQICPSFLIPENLLLYFTAQMDELFSGILVGSQKTEAGFDPESTDAEDGGSSEKNRFSIIIEHLEKFIAVRILRFTVSNTNRIGSMGNIIHKSYWCMNAWMNQWFGNSQIHTSNHQPIHIPLYCTWSQALFRRWGRKFCWKTMENPRTF